MVTLRVSKSRKEYDFHILVSQDKYTYGSCYRGNEAVAEVLAWIEGFWANVDEDTDLIVQLSYDSRVS